MGLVYEVNLAVDTEIADEYRLWLMAHAQEMLALPGFTAARILEVAGDATGTEEVVLCIQYELVGQQALDDYLRDHAARMRAEGVARFGDRFRASRRVLHDLGRY